MFISRSWNDYELIDASRGEKLERWGDVILRRPDPQIVWSVSAPEKSVLWDKADARYIRSGKGGGSWRTFKKIPESWTIGYKNLKFRITPMGFKHTGLFPEQAANWDWFSDIIRSSLLGKQPRIPAVRRWRRLRREPLSAMWTRPREW